MTTKPYPFTPEQEAWLTDLETTEEPQTTEFLRVTETVFSNDGQVINAVGYCCLGRACIVLGIDQHENEDSFITKFGKQRDEAMLPAEALVRLRLRDNTGTLVKGILPTNGNRIRIGCLTDMNDMGWSFKEIAAYIRANPENVFLPPEEDKE